MTTPARSRSTSALACLAAVVCLGCPGPARAPAAGPTTASGPPALQRAGPAKPGGAPVGITCAVAEGGAAVTFTAQAPLADVAVKAWGTRGLEVTGVEGAAAGADWAAGHAVTITVRYAPPPPGARLAVSVEGTAADRRRARVASFAIGADAVSAKPTTTDPSTGRELQVLPAK